MHKSHRVFGVSSLAVATPSLLKTGVNKYKVNVGDIVWGLSAPTGQGTFIECDGRVLVNPPAVISNKLLPVYLNGVEKISGLLNSINYIVKWTNGEDYILSVSYKNSNTATCTLYNSNMEAITSKDGSVGMLSGNVNGSACTINGIPYLIASGWYMGGGAAQTRQFAAFYVNPGTSTINYVNLGLSVSGSYIHGACGLVYANNQYYLYSIEQGILQTRSASSLSGFANPTTLATVNTGLFLSNV